MAGDGVEFTMLEVSFYDDVAIIKLKNQVSNRLTYAFLAEIHKGLDAVLRYVSHHRKKRQILI